MEKSFELPYLSSGFFELRGPVNLGATPNAAMNTIASGTTGTVKLYNDNNETKLIDLESKLSADEAAGQTTISVDDTTGFADGDTVRIDLDNGLIHPTTINGVPTATEITLAAGILTAASKNKAIRRTKLGTNATYLAVDSVGRNRLDPLSSWRVGLTISLVLDDLTTPTPATVTQVLTDPCPILVVDTAPTGAISTGREVKNKLGADITMADFGTFPSSSPTAGDKLWGYRGTVVNTHAGLIPGMYVRGEMDIVDGGIKLIEHAWATVKRSS